MKYKTFCKIKNTIPDVFRKTDTSITLILLYGDLSFSAERPTFSIHLLATYYPQKGLNLLVLQA